MGGGIRDRGVGCTLKGATEHHCFQFTQDLMSLKLLQFCMLFSRYFSVFAVLNLTHSFVVLSCPMCKPTRGIYVYKLKDFSVHVCFLISHNIQKLFKKHVYIFEYSVYDITVFIIYTGHHFPVRHFLGTLTRTIPCLGVWPSRCSRLFVLGNICLE